MHGQTSFAWSRCRWTRVMQEVCRYAVVHCFTFFHLTWLPRQAFILGIATRYLFFMLTLYISFLTAVTSVLDHLSIAPSLTSLVLLNLNLPLPVFYPLLSSSFPPSSLLILSFFFSPHPFLPLLLPLFPSSSTILSVFSLHQTVSIRRWGPGSWPVRHQKVRRSFWCSS